MSKELDDLKTAFTGYKAAADAKIAALTASSGAASQATTDLAAEKADAVALTQQIVADTAALTATPAG